MDFTRFENAIGDVVDEALSTAAESIMSGVSEVVDDDDDKLDEIESVVSSAFQKLLASLGSGISSIMADIEESVEDELDTARSYIEELEDTIAEFSD